MSKLIIGFITYGESTAKYLPYFLDSLKKQTFQDFETLAIDNSEEKENVNTKFVQENHNDINLNWLGENIGFAQAYNKMIKKAIDLGAEYFMVVNPDVALERDVLEKMIKVLSSDDKLTSVSPKILKWEFNNNRKTNIIDSCGIGMESGLRFVDVGQGEQDNEKFCNKKIIGPTGACGMYRLSALQKVKQDDQYFDELMFMYKEDADLAYRLFLKEFKSKCVCEAKVYHDRTAESSGQGKLKVIKDRKSKSEKVRAWSFLNQQIIFVKYWKQQNFYSKIKIILFEIQALIFSLLFERFLLKEITKLWKIRKKIKKYK